MYEINIIDNFEKLVEISNPKELAIFSRKSEDNVINFDITLRIVSSESTVVNHKFSQIIRNYYDERNGLMRNINR